ncbi:pectate lyase-like adhesive domain-containing protein [Candidatus Enterococcus murrayae]|uniref:Fibronectin type-III domain-containing protein n=1 Tax=Candidatus Enterococcus murrayae TaxID=2815321 RepID=A0ABS3HCF3_9ENTE|nr:pectate lyase-like adhesive domain-containing protein [Enterococcus sp. MJM16]MBO0451122.1 hypothetical protein [Enterococcus sp. MJM16]
MNKYKLHIILIFFFMVFSVCSLESPVQAEPADIEVVEPENTQESSSTQASVTENNEIVIENQKYEEAWLIVSTVSELQTALKNKEPYIKLADSTEIFDFGNTAIPITGDVTIDGNNRQISYNGGNLNSNKGLYTTVGGLTIRLQNMTFGSTDYTVPALGLYGIMQSSAAVQLHIENVNYYSNQSAQPFYLRNLNSKIYFYGTNQFMQQNPDGSTANGQEFAETNNLEFTAGSHTTIVQNTSDALGSVWMPANPASITVGEEAEVDITSNHNFIYSDGANNGVITLDNNSKLSVKGTNSAKGDFYYFNKPAFLTVGEGAEFSISYPNSIKIANGSMFKFLPDSIGHFSISDSESVFNRSVGANSTFEIDNAQQITFQGKPGTTYNPIGFVGGTNKFIYAPFSERTRGYGVMTEDTSLTSQLDAGTWHIASTDISRSVQTNTPDFTAAEKTALKNTNRISLTRLNPPVELLDVSQDIQVNEASFQLKEYQLNNNDEMVSGMEFKLYSKKVADPANDETGLIEQQSFSNLTDKGTFSNLKERTDYWLYVRIVCDPDSQSSDWLEVPFKTQQEMINVSFPIEAAFYTEKKAGQQAVIPANTYSIDNHSSFAVAIQATDIQELSNPAGIRLLQEEDETNQKDLFLNLTEGNRSLGALTEQLHESPLSFAELAGNASTTMGFSGKYYGEVKKAQQVQYRLTLTAARKE